MPSLFYGVQLATIFRYASAANSVGHSDEDGAMHWGDDRPVAIQMEPVDEKLSPMPDTSTQEGVANSNARPDSEPALLGNVIDEQENDTTPQDDELVAISQTDSEPGTMPTAPDISAQEEIANANAEPDSEPTLLGNVGDEQENDTTLQDDDKPVANQMDSEPRTMSPMPDISAQEEVANANAESDSEPDSHGNINDDSGSTPALDDMQQAQTDSGTMPKDGRSTSPFDASPVTQPDARAETSNSDEKTSQLGDENGEENPVSSDTRQPPEDAETSREATHSNDEDDAEMRRAAPASPDAAPNTTDSSNEATESGSDGSAESLVGLPEARPLVRSEAPRSADGTTCGRDDGDEVSSETSPRLGDPMAETLHAQTEDASEELSAGDTMTVSHDEKPETPPESTGGATQLEVENDDTSSVSFA